MSVRFLDLHILGVFTQHSLPTSAKSSKEGEVRRQDEGFSEFDMWLMFGMTLVPR